MIVIRSVVGAAAYVTAGFALAACNPCDGVVGCSQDARVSVGGQIVDRAAYGAPVAGVRVTVDRVGGAELGAESASSSTDAQGWWHVELPARAAAGEGVSVDVTVAPPAPLKPYRVSGLTLRTSTRLGDGQVFGRWVTKPYITYIGEIRDRATGAPVSGATVTFVRRGGIDVAATPLTQVTQPTTGIGYFTLDLVPSDFAPLVADFVVERPGYATTTIHSVSIMPGYEWGPPLATAASAFRIGLGLEYTVTVVDRGTGLPSAGWLTFARSGGIAVAPDRVQIPSGPGNQLPFRLTPATAGDVVGDAFFEPAGTRDTVYFRGLRLATFDSAQAPSLQLRYGEGLLYAGRAVDAMTRAPVVGAALRFRRTGGIALVSDTLTVSTDAAGRFQLAPATRARGEVTGELVAPSGAVASVRLATFAGDAAQSLGDVLLTPAR